MFGRRTYPLLGLLSVVAIVLFLAAWIRFKSDDGEDRPAQPVTSGEGVSHDFLESGARIQEGNNERTDDQEEPDGYRQLTRRTTGAVEFPNGVVVQPDWRPMVRPKNPEPMNNLDIPVLYELSIGGDPWAARRLVGIRESCEHAPVTREELNESVSRFRQTQSLGYSETEGENLVSPDQVTLVVEQMRRDFETCLSVRTTFGNEDIDFQKLAADNGVSIAMVDYGNSLPPDRAEEARSYYWRAWEDGEPEGLGQLARLAQRDYENGVDPEGRLRSATYYVAWASLMAERYQSTGSSVAAEEAGRLREIAMVRLEELMPNQREDVVDEAVDLVKRNDNCCRTFAFD
jgi:hypothetical protein